MTNPIKLKFDEPEVADHLFDPDGSIKLAELVEIIKNTMDIRFSKERVKKLSPQAQRHFTKEN